MTPPPPIQGILGSIRGIWGQCLGKNLPGGTGTNTPSSAKGLMSSRGKLGPLQPGKSFTWRSANEIVC